MHGYATQLDRSRMLAFLAVLAVLIAIAVQKGADALDVGPAWLISPPSVGSAFGLCYLAMDRRLWKVRLLHRVGLVDTPVVEGHYEGTLTTSWDGSERPVQLDIDQTWTRIAVRFRILAAESSTSFSVAAALDPAGHQVCRLTYTYRNQIRPGVADQDMRDHDGTAELAISSDGLLSGRYFNFRGRQGTLELRRS